MTRALCQGTLETWNGPTFPFVPRPHVTLTPVVSQSTPFLTRTSIRLSGFSPSYKNCSIEFVPLLIVSIIALVL